MNKLTMRAAALAALACLALGVLIAPSAAAQDSENYSNPLSLEDPIACGGDFYGSISGGTAPYTLEYQLLPGPINLPSFQVTTAGRYQSPPGYASAVPDGTFDVTVTLSDSGGQVAKAFTANVRAACPKPPVYSSGGIAGPTKFVTTTAAAAPAPASVPVATQPLAHTGSNIDMPVLIGFSMVGLGGLALLEARKRQTSAMGKH